MDLLPPNSHSKRIRFKLHYSMSQTATEEKPFIYAGCCMDFEGEDVTEMQDATSDEECTLATMREECVDFDEWCRILGYDEDLTIDGDFHVAYGRSYLRGIPCYWVNHSGIEYIWVDSRWLKAEKPCFVGTDTGRLSCKEPNMAQIPRTDLTPEQRAEKMEKLKALLRLMGVQIPEFRYDEIDYAELEERVAMTLTDKEKKELRAEAKCASFAGRYSMFGMGPVQFAARLQMRGEDPGKIREALREKYPGLTKIPFEHYERQVAAVAASGQPLGDHEVIIDDVKVMEQLVKDMTGVQPVHSLKELAKTLLTENTKENVLAIAADDMDKWGCPYCGYHQGQIPVTAHGTFLWSCLDCKKICHVLMPGLMSSTISTGKEDEPEPDYPLLSSHPREGTKKRTTMGAPQPAREGNDEGSEPQQS